MRRMAALLFVAIMILSAGAFAQEAARVSPDLYTKYPKGSSFVGYVEDEFVVVLKGSVPVNHAMDAASPVALSRVSGFDALAAAYRVDRMAPQFPGSDRGLAAVSAEGRRLSRYYKVRFTQGTLEEAMAAYAKNPFVDHVEPIGIHAVYATPNDGNYSLQWHLNQTSDKDVDAPEAWDMETGSTSVIVAMLDTGVRYYHKDLGGVNASSSNPGASRGSMWINWAEKNGTGGVDDDSNGYVDDWIGYDFVNGGSNCWTGEDCNTKDNDPRDFNGHGTHCAGNIGAINNNGYATCAPSGGWGNGTLEEYGNGVKVMACRVGWSANIGGLEYGYVRTDFCAEGLYYAANNGATIASCSWGSSNTGGLGDAVTYFINQGGLVFKAAGNDGSETADYMCGRSDVISVAATDQNDCKASFSNYGTWVDISAPGVGIYSLYHDHTNPANDYIASINGTSMATPLAASVAALIWSKNPSWTPAEVKQQLYDSAENIDGLSCNSAYIGKLGAGRINAFNAVKNIAVQVSSPNGGEIWNVDEEHLISWTIEGDTPDSINVYLSLNGGSTFGYTVAHGLAGTAASYNWTVPDLPVNTARIRVAAYIDDIVNGHDMSDADFTIKGEPYRYVLKTGGNIFPYSTPAWAARNIQDAVNAAAPGDSILVAGETYTSPVTVGKAVYLFGGWNNTFTVRDPVAYPTAITSAASNVSFMNVASGICGIEGFTLSGGTGSSAQIPVDGAYGGAVFSYQSSPVIKNNTIVTSGYADVTHYSAGGGIACYGGTPVIEGNELANCVAQSGGGIYLYYTNATLRHNTITGSAPNVEYTGTKVGGGIYAYHATMALEDNRIEQNDGYRKGGGIYVYIGSTSLSRDTISMNDCELNGGGIYSERSPLTIAHSLIRKNTSAGSNGGGIYFRAGTLNVTNTVIAQDTSGLFGGGIYADSTRGSVVNNTIDRNIAAYGGNVYVKSPVSLLTVKNNVLTYGAEYGFQATSMANVTYRYNNCYGNSPDNYDTVAPDATNISMNPHYADTAAVDYHLLVHSASIDAGDPAGGNDPDGSRADQGAYGGPAAFMAAPEYVKNLGATAVNDTTIQLTWDPSVSDVGYYAVYGEQTSGFIPSESVYLGSTADPGHAYLHKPVAGCWYYRVSAVNDLGYGGGYSSEANACALGPDIIPPTVQVVYPNGGETVQAGDTIEVKWHASDNRQVDSVSIYYSEDAGVLFNLIAHGCTADSTYEWITPSIASDSCLVRVVAYDPALLTGADTSNALFTIEAPPTGVDDKPAKYTTMLRQNFPNPFNPVTRIAYSIGAPGHVSLRIYDATGRLVRVLVDSAKPAGGYEAVWDGRDSAGRKVTSGIYFYRLGAGSFTQTKKMVLVR